jgi:hypothetical protein
LSATCFAGSVLPGERKAIVTSQQRQLVFMVASAVTVLLVIIGILYLAGAVIATGSHDRRAEACFVIAVVAAIVAFITRPASSSAR